MKYDDNILDAIRYMMAMKPVFFGIDFAKGYDYTPSNQRVISRHENIIYVKFGRTKP